MADAEDESADPAEDLGVSVCLEPCWRDTFGCVPAADEHQVPHAEECAGQKHEEQAAGNVENEQPRKLNLTRLGAFEDLFGRFGDLNRGLHRCLQRFISGSAQPCFAEDQQEIGNELRWRKPTACFTSS